MNDVLGAITGPWSCDTINGWGFSFLRIGDTSIQFPKNCYAEVTVFKTAEKDK